MHLGLNGPDFVGFFSGVVRLNSVQDDQKFPKSTLIVCKTLFLLSSLNQT